VDENGQPLNDITASRADFIVSEQDFHATLRQAMFEEMMDMLGKIAPVMPQAAMNLLDLVVAMSDIPAKDEFVKRIRKINGQRGPEQEADARGSSRKAAGAGDGARSSTQLALDKMRAEVKKPKHRARQLDASTMRELVTVLYEALQAGQIVATVPNVAPTADVIAASVGFQPQNGASPQIPEPSGALPSMTPQSIHGDYVGAAGGIGAGGTTDVPPQPDQSTGAQQGIQTVRNDGATAP
jgi:hypothetical protein